MDLFGSVMFLIQCPAYHGTVVASAQMRGQGYHINPVSLRAVAFHIFFRRRAGRFGTRLTGSHLMQKFSLVKVFIVQYMPVLYLQPQGHPLKPGVLMIFLRQFTTTVYHDLIAHIFPPMLSEFYLIRRSGFVLQNPHT
jgi:hypothetical protein